ncbi:hypothetical protein CIB48_g12130 [Xylaria polymorpha]|nr:hypothetical protein CIB48_g12130 [Xylaria polymorpha]
MPPLAYLGRRLELLVYTRLHYRFVDAYLPQQTASTTAAGRIGHSCETQGTFIPNKLMLGVADVLTKRAISSPLNVRRDNTFRHGISFKQGIGLRQDIGVG